MAIRFKVGMKVQINSQVTGINNFSNPHVSNFGCALGDIVYLLKYDSKDETWLVSKTGEERDAFWMKRANLKPLDKDVEISTFKIGDRVTILKEQSSPIRVPAKGTVIRVGDPNTGEGYGVTIDKEFLTKSHSANWLYDAVNMRAAKKVPQEYKVGDKVVIVKNTTSGHKVGTECTIAEMPNGVLSYKLVNSTGTGMRHPASNFTLIKTTKTEVMSKTQNVQEAFAAHLNLKVGDKVKVLRKAESRELGWTDGWLPTMNASVGQTFEVIRMGDLHSLGVTLNDRGNYAYPYHVLEVVSRKVDKKTIAISSKYSAVISADQIEVGCQTIDQALMQKLVDGAREMGMKIK